VLLVVALWALRRLAMEIAWQIARRRPPGPSPLEWEVAPGTMPGPFDPNR
jgi:hypothetical protein